MSTVMKIAVLVLLLVVGPVMFVFSRGNALALAFGKVNVGDSAETVRSTMGPPQAEARTNLHLHGDTEYHYYVWPIPGLWVVSLANGKVIEKAKYDSP